MWVKSLKIKSVGFNYYFIIIIIFTIHFHYFSYHLPTDRSNSILLPEILILDPHLLILRTEMGNSQLCPTLFSLDRHLPYLPCQHRHQDLCSAISTFHEMVWFFLWQLNLFFNSCVPSWDFYFLFYPRLVTLLFTNTPSLFPCFRL